MNMAFIREYITEHSGELYCQDIPGIYLQQGALTCTTVLSTVTFGISPLEPSSLITLGMGALLDIRQVPLDKDKIKWALYEFSKKVAQQKEVVAVTCEAEKEVIRIWTFIKKRDKQVRRSIYTWELELMNSFPDLIFDFNVVSLEASRERPFIPSDLQGYLIFYRNYQSGQQEGTS